MLKRKAKIVEATTMAVPPQRRKLQEVESKNKKKSIQIKLPDEEKPTLTLNQLITEKDSLAAQKKLIEERESAIKKQIAYVAHHQGVKTDTGSYNFVYGERAFEMRAKNVITVVQDKAIDLLDRMGLLEEGTEKVLDPEKAEKVLKKHGLFHQACKRVATDGLLELLLKEGSLSMDDLEEITERVVTYGVYLSNVKQEEEEKPPMVVAQTKSKLKRKGSR